MQLTKLGEDIAKSSGIIKTQYISGLLDGTVDITQLVVKPVCYEAVAYVVYLSGLFSLETIHNTSGKGWIPMFKFLSGPQWDGQNLPIGAAIGFYSIEQGTFFHSAISLGKNTTTIRSVNGGRLGQTWLQPVDIHPILGLPSPDGAFNYDGGTIRVYRSALQGG
ncbi:urea amidohydrolase [Phyllobacterium salinisoli]|uniref:urea amidohydrolase n=1 Tax=Phyllobacterium salinisoli TaxID=1899321 RepID=UPI0011C03A90|nr:urea amidohydrolase [Phyllobacterium salinisoli]